MILICYGTRPEYIKVKPIMEELTRQKIKFKTLFTGQHNNIVESKSDFTLSILDSGNNRLDNILSSCLRLDDMIFDDIDFVMVQGDTTSALGMSIACMHRNIKIIHLEAGLRTYDFNHPYPEEYNRKLISSISDIHFCPTELNKENLEKEHIQKNIYVVGNTVLDNLLKFKSEISYSNKILITLHRRENHKNIKKWFEEIESLAKKYPQFDFYLPIHPNPNVLKHKNVFRTVNIVDPLPYEKMIELLKEVRLVITDSGGLQEECSFLNKKCLVCREKTERPESLNISSFLVHSPENLHNIFEQHCEDYQINIKSPFGDGNSSVKIIDILKNKFFLKKQE